MQPDAAARPTGGLRSRLNARIPTIVGAAPPRHCARRLALTMQGRPKPLRINGCEHTA
jgi:hypothetical protein